MLANKITYNQILNQCLGILGKTLASLPGGRVDRGFLRDKIDHITQLTNISTSLVCLEVRVGVEKLGTEVEIVDKSCDSSRTSLC